MSPTTTSTDKKLRDAVAYVVDRFCARQNAPLTRTKLVKYLYLTDYLSAQQRHRPVTGIQYKSYYYGPYAPEILEAAESQPQYIAYESFIRSDGAPYYAYRPTGTKPRYETLSTEDREAIEGVLTKYASLSLTELLREVYQTPPFQNAEMLEQINLSS
jgi:uncharacterized phage-associated protein